MEHVLRTLDLLYLVNCLSKSLMKVFLGIWNERFFENYSGMADFSLVSNCEAGLKDSCAEILEGPGKIFERN